MVAILPFLKKHTLSPLGLKPEPQNDLEEISNSAFIIGITIVLY